MDQPILPYVQKYKRYFQAVMPVFQKKETKTYSTVVLFILVVSLFGWYAIRPTVQTIIYLRREIKDKTELSQKMDQKINALIEAQAVLDSSSSYLPMISEAIPDAPEPFVIIEGLKNLASSSKASVSGIQVRAVPLGDEAATPGAKSASEKSSSMNEMNFSLSVDGSYPNLTQFVRQILSLRRVLHIKNINFIPGTEKVSSTSSRPTLRMVFDGIGYYGIASSL